MAAVLHVLRNLYLAPNHKGTLLNVPLEVPFSFSHLDSQAIIGKSDQLFLDRHIISGFPMRLENK